MFLRIAAILVAASVALLAFAGEAQSGKAVRKVVRSPAPKAEAAKSALKIEAEPDAAEEIVFGRVGEFYSFSFTVSGGGRYGYIWDGSGLPAGLTMKQDDGDGSTAVIEGEPLLPGAYVIKLEAVDVSDEELRGEFKYRLNIAPAPY